MVKSYDSLEELYKVLIEKGFRIKTNSKQIIEGDIFWALKGNNYDGNDFVEEALNKGAILAIAEKNKKKLNNVIVVNDSLKTLQKVANYHRNILNVKIIGITGSNGKTTTKELVASVLSQKFKVLKTEKNLNNHIGVPLMLLRLTNEVDFAVIEMGANKTGEIAELCEIAEPDYGIVTNIGKAHLEGFGSIENVINTKTALYDFVRKKNGVIFVNSSNEILLERSKGFNAFYYGMNDFAVLKINSFKCDPFLSLTFSYKGHTTSLNTNLLGDYNWENVAAALAVGFFFNIETNKIIKGIESYIPSDNRSQLSKTNLNLIYVDAYNANPTSLNFALDNFLKIFKDYKNKTIILGDMLELGKYSDIEHINIINKLSNLHDVEVFLIGENFYRLNNNNRFVTFRNVEEFINYIQKFSIKDRTIFIKGSHGVGLEKILPYL